MEEYGCFIGVELLLITNNVETILFENSVKCLCSKLRNNKSIMKSLFIANGIEYNEILHYSSSIINQEVINLNQNQNNNMYGLTDKFYNCKYPFSFPNRFNIVCLTHVGSREELLKQDQANEFSNILSFDDDNFKLKDIKKRKNDSSLKPYYLTELIQLNGSMGKLFSAPTLDTEYVTGEFTKCVYDQVYANSGAIYHLKFGNMESNVQLWPSPMSFKGYFLF